MELHSYFVDLHIHIGQTESGRKIKISGSKDLTFHRIMEEASQKKGMDMVGIIDCHSPAVQFDIDLLVQNGTIIPLEKGGLRYKNTTVLLGTELEVREQGYGLAHVLVFLPNIEKMKAITYWLSFYMKNVVLSSQRVYRSTKEILDVVTELQGIMIPAHIFTPFRSMYGSATDRMNDIVDTSRLAAVELGLSADSDMADRISELSVLSFVTNSDAHSLGKIAREYNVIMMKEPNYEELVKALRRVDGRCVKANYGLNPYLGKYHATFCLHCDQTFNYPSPSDQCPHCGSLKWTKGVVDRINEIADHNHPKHPSFRPPYVYQVPLQFIPGIGPKRLAHMLDHFGTEMNILHRISEEQLLKVVPESIVQTIINARTGKLQYSVGGGGTYGRIQS